MCIIPDSWPAPALTAISSEAIVCYRRGIAALVAGTAYADTLLAAALAADPDFYLSRLGLSVAHTVVGRPFVAPPSTSKITRGERQHAEIVRSTFAGAVRHANDLRREHLLEYPGDLLIVWLPSLASWKVEAL
jgi:hypothetical protein